MKGKFFNMQMTIIVKGKEHQSSNECCNIAKDLEVK